MATITSIKPQKKGKRVNIYLDGKFSFGLDLENYMRLGLKIDQELSEEEVGEIVKKGEFQKTSDKLLNFAMIRPRSKSEITDWLRRKKVNETIHTGLFNKLKRLELLDDEKFAKWWVNQRLEFRKKSKKEIQFELRSKGISNEVIKNVLDGFEIDEEQIVKDLIKQKKYKWERYEKKVREQKMKEYLMRKGFGWNIISKMVQ
ncbi:RecX family transcriptional regulator [Candidatus Microgenomates bacterium]|nr:RecX family transcriptional regulator [Candidatus Microgenomates bacterium]